MSILDQKTAKYFNEQFCQVHGDNCVIIVFQKDCRECERQFTQIDCLNLLDSLKIELLAVGNDRLRLIHRAKSLGFDYRLFSFSQAYNYKISATPTILFRKKGTWSKHTGFLECAKIKGFLDPQ